MQEGLAKFLRWMIVAEMVALVVAVFTQVFSRYILNSSVPWTEEVARYILVYLTFTGGALAVYENTHLRVDVLLDACPPLIERGLRALSGILMAVTAILLIYYGARFTYLARGTISPAIDQPMAWVYAIMPLAGVLMLVYALLQTSAELRGRRREQSDSGQAHG